VIKQSDLRCLFKYRKRDGELVRRISTSPNAPKGSVAGTINKVNGYRYIHLNGSKRTAHRLVWIFHHGPIGKGLQVDHINGVRGDNRIENLRLATQSENTCNSKLTSRNTSGFKGVCWDKKRCMWFVRVSVFGKPRGFGYYENLELAALVASEAREKYHKEFCNHG
jgi:hypothetical protein